MRIGVFVAVATMLAAVPTGRWLLQRRTLAWQVRRGLELLDRADTPARVRDALEQWENETRPRWEQRTEELIGYLCTACPLEDHRVRCLLALVAGTDYGTRREDWQRWYQTRQRLRQGMPPRVTSREAVTLTPLWDAPVGLTAWFTTILPMDGQVYVASLGTGFDDPQDAADGVVRVDGATGASELFFAPPSQHRGPRDVVGISAADEGLLVACHNGWLYRIDLLAQPVWQTHVGDPIVTPPLATDINADGATDALVATRAGKIVALSGKSGKTTWVASVGRPWPGVDMLGATLSLGNLLGDGDLELLVTIPPGNIEALSLRNGRSLWRHELTAGVISGAICAGGLAYLGDRAACVWSLAASRAGLDLSPWQALGPGRDETLVAALRTITIGGNQALAPSSPSLVLACPTGEYGDQRGAVAALSVQGLAWRVSVQSTIWGTPAVAGLNRDSRPEIVVASVEPQANGQLGGLLTILSATGHHLLRMPIEAPVECSPTVADVDGDGRLEVLVADQAGWLRCFTTEGYGPVEWGLYGGDSHNTRNAANAYAYGQRLFGYQRAWQPSRGDK